MSNIYAKLIFHYETFSLRLRNYKSTGVISDDRFAFLNEWLRFTFTQRPAGGLQINYKFILFKASLDYILGIFHLLLPSTHVSLNHILAFFALLV